MAKKNVSYYVSAGLRGLGSLFVPKTPRGRVRQAVFLVLVLFVVAGSLTEPKYWDKAADWTKAKIGVSVPHFWNLPFRLGLDLQGGTHLVYVADMKDIPTGERDEAISGVRDVIERRVNAFGISEPLVQTNKSGEAWRVTVDLAGVKNISDAIKQIGETPILEFKEQGDGAPERALTPDEQKQMDVFNAAADKKADEVLTKARAAGADFAQLAKEYSDDAATKDKGGDLGFVDKEGPYAELVTKALDTGAKEGTVLRETVTTSEGHNIVKYNGRQESGQEIRAQHILICWKGIERCNQERTKEEAKALADNLKGRATAANFAALAKQNSDDAGSAAEGGDLNWFGKGAMVPAFETAAFALAKGGISDVVESPFGYHIILKTDERPLYQYGLARILVKTKSAADYLPAPSPWKNTQLSGKHLKKSVLEFNPNTGEPQVGIEFNDEGKTLFADITKRNVGKPVAIFLDGQPLSVPTVQEAILEGKAVITGKFSIVEAKTLVRRLNAGALPVPITLESQQTVGATLGQDSLDKSLYAGLMGFLIIAAFMLLYYRLPGVIAILALLLYTVLNLSLFKMIPVTLTLSGIAGVILSIGMAVDANVLIFERTKEELLRGRPLQSAIDEGFKRAWPSIRDSNLTTLISCTILFYTSSSLIKGFALTLGIGVLVSMFSAITVSRTLLRLVGGWGWLHSTVLYLPGLHRAPATAAAETPAKEA
ncbi:MAG: protein translocase subunit SecD [Patescibacteria group bacterium]|nr:protein translocase subunit SecD [Patescibacteria group bacterium]